MSSENKIEELEKKLKAEEERGLRVAADFDNSKKRLEKRSRELIRFANERLVGDLLPVVDDLDRAIRSLDTKQDLAGVKEGLHLVQDNFHKILKRNGVEPIEALGKPFDPELHEAVGHTDSEEQEDGTIVEEIQRGYTLNGRLARPARVRIAQKRNAQENGKKSEDSSAEEKNGTRKSHRD